MMEKYILFKGLSIDKSYIVSTTPPFYKARLYAFSTNMEYAEFTNGFTGLAYAHLAPYRILIVFDGSLGGHIYAYPGIIKELRNMMAQMGEHYRLQVIKGNETNFDNLKM